MPSRLPSEEAKPQGSRKTNDLRFKVLHDDSSVIQNYVRYWGTMKSKNSIPKKSSRYYDLAIISSLPTPKTKPEDIDMKQMVKKMQQLGGQESKDRYLPHKNPPKHQIGDRVIFITTPGSKREHARVVGYIGLDTYVLYVQSKKCKMFVHEYEIFST